MFLILFLDGSWRIITYSQILQTMWQPKRRIGVISREPLCKAEQQNVSNVCWDVQASAGCCSSSDCSQIYLTEQFDRITSPSSKTIAVGHWDFRNSSHIFPRCCLEVNSSWNTFLQVKVSESLLGKQVGLLDCHSTQTSGWNWWQVAKWGERPCLLNWCRSVLLSGRHWSNSQSSRWQMIIFLEIMAWGPPV